MDANKIFFINSILKSFKNSGLRSLVIFIAIMIGACVSSAFINVYADIDAKVSKELNSYGANLIISPSDFEKENFISEKNLSLAFSKIPKELVLAQGKFLFSSANIGTTSAVVMGVNFESLKKVMPYLDLQSGKMINLDFDNKNALIGVNLAKIAGFKVGDEVEIKNSFDNNVIKVRIKGVVYDGEKEDNLLIISLSLAQEFFKKDGLINYSNAIINTDFQNLSQISKNLSNKQIHFEPVSKISKSQGAILDKIKLLMALISIIILIITAICVNTSLSSILLSRLKEIALLRAIGASKKNILNLYTGEIFTLAMLASIVGAFAGFLLAQILGEAIFSSTINFRFISVVVAIIVSLVFAFLASFYPIKKALNANMANLLRGE
ncbi:ABC transporter permease [Campylobacter geochelonis]|uniref:ABC transporter permease n=1 Tax=Campylobacter geochelonis TaxID=1780362 RepID=UPI000770743F|nr:FtsX-like permease family protein [Campylobacter geochelonis]CZE47170.1 integral membrane protein-permease%2C involved in lipoprotein release [Campylobacter geochelonis]